MEQLAKQIVTRLKTAGFQAYFVGGCVRDLLLGKQPLDYDVATNASPDEVLALYPRSKKVGAHFGVVLVSESSADVEVATFRSDHNYSDGRHPGSVNFERDPRQDAFRRDFTVNALFLDPETNQVLDFVGGRQDLNAGIIRAIGEPERRFEEDHLRMLRAIRFAARLQFAIHDGTLAAVLQAADKILLVSAERIHSELSRILTEGGARHGLELLDQSGLLAVLLPEVARMKGVQQPPQYHPEGDVWTHTLLMLAGLPKDCSATLAWGVLLHDVGKPPTFQLADRIRFNGHVEAGVEIARNILNRLRFSTHDIEQIEALVANHMRFKDAPHMRESTLKRFLRMDSFDEHLELHRLDCQSSHGLLSNYDFVRDKRNSLGEAKLAPPRLVTGRDLIEAGYKPGPAFSRILEQLEDAQLEGRIFSKEDGLLLAKQLIPPASAPTST